VAQEPLRWGSLARTSPPRPGSASRRTPPSASTPEPFGHARHYLGWAGSGNLGARLAHHQAGSGANLLRHVAKAGISWELVRTWAGDRYLERRLKNRGGHARLCPNCH
jgi:hypothetical protein